MPSFRLQKGEAANLSIIDSISDKNKFAIIVAKQSVGLGV
jgi:hypothetical protein